MREHQYSIMEVRLKRWNTAHKQRCIKAGLAYENVDLFAMFEAAGWVCYICSEAIDPELRHPHQMSPSVDHEIALKAGGGHTAKNCRASHLGCNLHKARKRDSKIIAKVRRLRGETGQKKRRDERKAKEADRLQGKTGNGPKRKIPSRPFPARKTEWPRRPMETKR